MLLGRAIMYAPRVFLSILCVLVVFALASFFISGSVYTAFIHTLLCAVIIQVGYFVGIVYLVHREKLAGSKDRTDAAVKSRPREASNLSSDVTSHLPAQDI
jgi:exopolysaccharide production repressor protein